jgi:hypothetical protein
VRRALVLAALLCPAVAHADAGVTAASAALGGGTFTRPGPKDDTSVGPTAGGLLLFSYEHDFSESFSWRLEASGGLYGGGGLSWSGAASGGLVYRFDVLKYVPYALVELGGVAVGGGELTESAIDPVLEIGGGVDWLTARDRSWGVEARVAGFAGDTMTYSLSLRRTFRWGFF